MENPSREEREGVLRWFFDIIFDRQYVTEEEIRGERWARVAVIAHLSTKTSTAATRSASNCPIPHLTLSTRYEMTKAKHAWSKANACVQSGQHDKAIYWLSRTQAILDGERSPRYRRDGMDAGYMLVGFAALVLIWVVALQSSRDHAPRGAFLHGSATAARRRSVRDRREATRLTTLGLICHGRRLGGALKAPPLMGRMA
jgi:hypothetical protein